MPVVNFHTSASPSILFIRHALPVVDEAVPSRLWPLSDEGLRAARELADRLRLLATAHVVSSDEVKARQTAEIFSDRVVLDARLREVSRPWFDGDYASVARSWLSGGDVEGWEAKQAVVNRMSDAVGDAVRQADGVICVVTHGLAMSAFIAGVVGLDPVSFWLRLGFPDVRIADIGAREVHGLDGPRSRR